MAATDDYFRRPVFIWRILVPIGLSIVFVSRLKPQLLPREHLYLLGPLGNLTLLLVDKYPQVLAGIFYTAVGLHIGEAFYAYYLCQKKNLTTGTQWALQTLVYGVFSLRHLLSYHPKQQ